MLEGMIFLVNGGAFGNLINQWEQMGVFTYALPFLLIFAIIFGVLSTVNIFKDNRSINAIIALAVSLMSLQFDFVNVFFAQIFPRLGVGLAIIIVILIIAGLFAPSDSWVTITLFIISAIIFLIILIDTFGSLGWSLGALSATNWNDLVPWIVMLVLLIIVVGVASPKQSNAKSLFTGFIDKAMK